MERESPRFKLPAAQISWHDDTQDFYFAGQLEDYRVMNKLGQGQFGVVKLGVHVVTGDRVALKIINKADLSDVERESLKREAEVMSYLNHKNVIRTIAVIENRINLCLVMEYAAGGELFDHIIRQVKLKEVEARNLFVQMLQGIEYCHLKRIAHRDIKAENIFLDEKLEAVKIGDFGFSSVIGDDREEEACGSLDYAAPEILGGKSKPGPEGDIWALGVVLYFMVTGTLPFKAATDFDVYQKIRKADYRPLPSSMSTDLSEVIKIIFNTNPAERPTAAILLKLPWCQQAFKDPEYLKHPKMQRMLQLQIKQSFHVRVKKMSESDAIAHGEAPSSSLSPRSLIASASAPNLAKAASSDSATAPTVSQPSMSLSSKVAAAKLARARSSQRAQAAPVPVAQNPVIPEDKMLSPAKRSSSKNSSRDSSKPKKPKEKGSKKEGEDSKKESDKASRSVKKKRRKNEILEEDEEGVEVDNTEVDTSPRAPEPIEAIIPPLSPKVVVASLALPPGGLKVSHVSPDQASAPISSHPTIKAPSHDDGNESTRVHERRPSNPPPVLPLSAISSSLKIKISSSTSISPRSGRKPSTPLPLSQRDERKSERLSRSSSRHTSPTTSPSPSPRRKSTQSSALSTSKEAAASPRARKGSISGRPSRSSTLRMSDFSVIKLNQEQLDRLVAKKEIEILSVEKEGDTNVVVVSAPASRLRMNTVRDLFAQFEKNATKLKRSKSIENVANTISLFGDINYMSRSVGQTKRKDVHLRSPNPKDANSPDRVRISPADRPEPGSVTKKIVHHRARSNSYNHEIHREQLQRRKDDLSEIKVRKSASRESPAKDVLSVLTDKAPQPLSKSADFTEKPTEEHKS